MTKVKSHALRLLRSFAHDDNGAVAVEYGILLLMVAIALLGMSTLSNVANSQSNTFNYISSVLGGD
jgi:pilus assembly protein Flp/PilA